MVILLHLAFYGALSIIGALTLRLRMAAGEVPPREDSEIADLKRGEAAQREPP